MNDEIWVPIIGYEGVYEISNLGRVKSVQRTIEHHGAKSGFYNKSEKILSPHRNLARGGYFEVNLWKGNKSKNFKIHRLVANAFIPNQENKSEVNHKDGDKSNNCVNNLEWATSQENINHAWNNNLINSNHRKVPIKWNETGICYESVVAASKATNCDRRSIFRVLSGEYAHTKNKTFSYITKEEYEKYCCELNKTYKECDSND